MQTATEAKKFENISATTSPFTLKGGRYGISLIGDNFGTAKLQILAGDLTTYVSIGTATDFAADGYTTADLAPGQYRWTVATADAIYAVICSIP